MSLTSGAVSGASETFATPWRLLARLYGRLEATKRGYFCLSKVLPAYLFGFIALSTAFAFAGTLRRLAAGELHTDLLLLGGHQASSALFMGLVATMYLARRRPIQRVEGPLQAGVALAGTYAMLPIGAAGVVHRDPTLLLVADLLMVVGFAGAALSLAYLGRCFGIFPEARGLVQRGPYRFIRHPMYLFEFVGFFGLLLPALTPLNVAPALLFVSMQLARMVYEEQVLSATFPDAYPDYRERTARLIPGVY